MSGNTKESLRAAQARFNQKKRDQGLVKFQVWIKPEQAEKIKELLKGGLV